MAHCPMISDVKSQEGIPNALSPASTIHQQILERSIAKPMGCSHGRGPVFFCSPWWFALQKAISMWNTDVTTGIINASRGWHQTDSNRSKIGRKNQPSMMNHQLVRLQIHHGIIPKRSWLFAHLVPKKEMAMPSINARVQHITSTWHSHSPRHWGE